MSEDEKIEAAGAVSLSKGAASGKIQLPAIVAKSLFGGIGARRDVQRAAATRLSELIRDGKFFEASAEERELLATIVHGQESKISRKIRVLEHAEASLEGGTTKALPGASATTDREDVDADWLLDFWSKAENVSNAGMQEFFGRVLAGKIRSPSSVPKSMLPVLAALDPNAAGSFVGQVVPCTVDGSYLLDFLLPTVNLGQPALEELDDSGLLHAHGTGIRKFGGRNGVTKVFRLGHKITVSVEGLAAEPMYAVIPLTGSGRRLFAIVEAQASSGDDERARMFASWLLHNGRGSKAVVESDGEVTHEVAP